MSDPRQFQRVAIGAILLVVAFSAILATQFIGLQDIATTLTPAEAEAVATAKAAIAEHPELSRFVHFHKPWGNPVSGRWSVTVSGDSDIQGDHVSVEIGPDGKVTRILRGL